MQLKIRTFVLITAVAVLTTAVLLMPGVSADTGENTPSG